MEDYATSKKKLLAEMEHIAHFPTETEIIEEVQEAVTELLKKWRKNSI